MTAVQVGMEPGTLRGKVPRGLLCFAGAWPHQACSGGSEPHAGDLRLFPEQVAADEWRTLIQEAILKPEVRRYMFYNSRAFQIAIAVVRASPRLAVDVFPKPG